MNFSFFFKKQNKTKRKLKRKTYRKKTLKKRKRKSTHMKKKKKMKGGMEAPALRDAAGDSAVAAAAGPSGYVSLTFKEKGERAAAGGKILEDREPTQSEKTCYVCGYTYEKRTGFSKSQLRNPPPRCRLCIRDGKDLRKVLELKAETKKASEAKRSVEQVEDEKLERTMSTRREQVELMKNFLRPHKEEIIKKFKSWDKFSKISRADPPKSDEYYEFYFETSPEFQENLSDDKPLEHYSREVLKISSPKIMKMVIHTAIMELDEERRGHREPEPAPA